MTKEEIIKYIEFRASGINQAINYDYKEFYKEMLEMCEHEKQVKQNDLLHSVIFKTDEFSIYRPQNNEPEVILIEDIFGHCREIDEPDFNNLMRVLHAVQDY